MKIRWLEEARLEAVQSARYYRSQDRALGPAFTAEIKSQLAFVQRFPETGFRLPRTKDLHVRRARLDRFEYGIVFALLDGEIVVIAVHHLRRRPGYWRPRLAKAAR